MKQVYEVREIAEIVIDADVAPVATFDSFFDACDYIDEHPEMSLYIEAVDK